MADLQPWGDNVPLRGPDAPKNDGQIKHLIEYLLTVHKRYGNTAVTCSLQWGATALWKRDEQAAEIARLSEALITLRAVAGRYLPNYDEHPAIQEADAAIEAAKQ